MNICYKQHPKHPAIKCLKEEGHDGQHRDTWRQLTPTGRQVGRECTWSDTRPFNTWIKRIPVKEADPNS